MLSGKSKKKDYAITEQDALNTIEQMPEDEFQAFFTSLPCRVQLCCKGGLANWKEILPKWYIKRRGGN